MNILPKKTKILFVITKSNFGGAQKYVYDLATSIPKDRFDVAVAVGGAGVLISKLREQNIRVLPILSLERDIQVTSDIRTFFELQSIFRKERPDIVHLNSAKVGGIGTLAARLANIPKIIFTVHGWAFNEDRSMIQRILIKFFSWITLLLSHQTIAVSNAVKKDAEEWVFVKNKITVIQNGCAKPEFFNREEARAKLFSSFGISLPENAIALCTIAELHKNKGLDYAIKAMSKLVSGNQNLYYFILGDGQERERLTALIQQKGLQEHVFLLGFVDNAASFLIAFDIFIFPSRTESFGLALLEAGFAKLPIIASRVGGIPEIIDDMKTGMLVPARDEDALARAIETMLASKEQQNSFTYAFLQKIEHRFPLSGTVNETLALYTKK